MVFHGAYCFQKTSLAACFMACEDWSSVFEKYWHIYVTALYSLKTGCISIFFYQSFKATSENILTKQELGCLFKCISKSSSFNIDKAL